MLSLPPEVPPKILHSPDHKSYLPVNKLSSHQPVNRKSHSYMQTNDFGPEANNNFSKRSTQKHCIYLSFRMETQLHTAKSFRFIIP